MGEWMSKIKFFKTNGSMWEETITVCSQQCADNYDSRTKPKGRK